MITPNDLKLNILKCTDFEQLEQEIDKSIKQHHNYYKWEYACLDKELPLEVRNELTRRYKKGGWTYVYHRTTSENNERPGLTSFLLSIDPIEEKYRNNYKTCDVNEPIYQEMQPEITYTLPIANGKLVIDISKEDNFPGLDIEFISDDIREDVVKPRILIESPIDEETKHQSNLRALIWAGAYQKDYTDSVIFTNQQLGKVDILP